MDFIAARLAMGQTAPVPCPAANSRLTGFAGVWLALVIVFFSVFARAGYSDQLWQVADGLPSSQVRAILQSSDGYLWLGTVEGLARFDGLTFTTVERRNFREMKNQLYIALAETRDGSIWFSNGHGLSRHLDAKVTYYGTNNGLPSDYVMTAICDKAGELLVGTDKGVCKLQDDRFVPFAAGDPISNAPVRAIVEDKKGNLWFGSGKGLFRFRDGNFTAFTKEQGELKENAIFALAEGTNGRIWVASSAGLTRIDESGSTHFTAKQGLFTNIVRSVFCDTSGTLWVGTQAGVQYLVNEAPPFLSPAMTSSADSSSNGRDLIYKISEDDEHNIWLGSNRGLFRLKPERFKVFSQKEGLPNKSVNTVFEDSKHRIWIGTAAGIARIEGDKVIGSLVVKSENGTNRFPAASVLSIMEDENGDMWFGTQIGVYRIKDNTLLHYTAEKSKLADNTARCMLQFNPKTYFIGNNNGLTRYRFQLFTNFGAKIGLPFNDVKALAIGKQGRLWVGSEDGLTVLIGETHKRFTTKDGLSSEWINAVYVDKEETLWIGTENGGLDRFRDAHFVAITPAASGIFSERIYSILEDDENNLWMGTRHGIFNVRKKDLDDFADGKLGSVHCTSYGRADGLRSIQCNGISQPAACKAHDGKMWFATSDGVAVIDAHKVILNTTPAKIVLQKVLVDGQPVTPAKQMRFPPGKGNLQFEYTGICFQAPEKVRFQYKLNGVDSDWMDGDTRHVASYGNIGPGSYEFLLRACNNDGIWSEKPASFSFTLTPHFYQTTTFYVVIAAVIGLGVLAFHTTRVRRLAQREKELRELVDKRTEHLQDALQSMETFTYSMAHDLRSPLRAIRGLTHVLFDEYRQHFDATAINYSQRIDKSVEKMDALINDLLVYGRLAHSNIPMATVNVENTLDKVRTELDAQIRARNAVIDVTGSLPEVRANAVLLQQVLINLVSNAIKFVDSATTPRLRIWAKTEQGMVRIFIEDNGIGIKPEYHERIFNLFERLHAENVYPGTGVGLAIVRKAIERMGGRVGVKSEHGKGACFWIELASAHTVCLNKDPNRSRPKL